MAKPIFGSALSDFGNAASAYGARTAVVVGIAENSLIPVGWHLIECDAHTSVRFTYDSGGNYVTLLAASAVGYVWSDGKAFSVLGDGTGGTAHRSEVLGAEG